VIIVVDFLIGIFLVVAFFGFVEYMKAKDGKKGPLGKLIDKFK
jgi:hypothetical protein